MRQKNGGRKMKEANAIFKEGNKRRRHSVKKCGSKRWGENRIFYMRKPRELRSKQKEIFIEGNRANEGPMSKGGKLIFT